MGKYCMDRLEQAVDLVNRLVKHEYAWCILLLAARQRVAYSASFNASRTKRLPLPSRVISITFTQHPIPVTTGKKARQQGKVSVHDLSFHSLARQGASILVGRAEQCSKKKKHESFFILPSVLKKKVSVSFLSHARSNSCNESKRAA